MKPTTSSIVVHWCGPWTFEQATKFESPGLYMAYGRNRIGSPPAEPFLLYCGITATKDVGKRVYDHLDREFNHPKNRWWIGYQEFPKSKWKEKKFLERAEWNITYFCRPYFSEKKVINPPNDAVYLINEWFTLDEPNGEKWRRRKNRIDLMTEIPDVICWTPRDWWENSDQLRKGNLKVYDHDLL